MLKQIRLHEGIGQTLKAAVISLSGDLLLTFETGFVHLATHAGYDGDVSIEDEPIDLFGFGDTGVVNAGVVSYDELQVMRAERDAERVRQDEVWERAHLAASKVDERSQAFKMMQSQIASGLDEEVTGVREYHRGHVFIAPYDWRVYLTGKWLAGEETIQSRLEAGTGVVMEGVREYGEGEPVKLDFVNRRLVVVATNQGGYDATNVDVIDLLNWWHANHMKP